MTIITHLTALICSFLLLTPATAKAADRLPMPAMIKNPNKLDAELVRLKQLLDEGKMIPFYKGAHQILINSTRARDTETTPQELADGLFLCYLIATAPFIDLSQPDNVVWLCNYTNLDYTTKELVSKCVPYLPLNDKKSKLAGKEEALHFYLCAKSLILKQFKTEYEPNLEAIQQRELQQAEADPRMQAEPDKMNEFTLRISTREARNYSVKAIIERKENSLVFHLMRFYPTKAAEVKKYIRLAGYTDADIPGLLDRTVGRVPKAEYLYKGLPKSRK